MKIYSSPGKDETSDTIKKGNYVIIDAVYENYGRISALDGSTVGWTKLMELSLASVGQKLEKGDVNGDRKVDKYDLALLNEYLKRSADMPRGVSYLRRCELEAADLNDDGALDGSDVICYLKILRK